MINHKRNVKERQSPSPLLRSAALQLPHLRGREEVHHRLITFLNGKQLWNLYTPTHLSCFPARCAPNCFPQCPLLVVPLRFSGGRGAPASGSSSRITSSTNRHLAAQPVSTSSSYPPSQYHRFSHLRTTPAPDHLHSAPTSASRLVATLVPYSSSSLLAHQPNQF